jgi:hypothetical protein
MAQERFILTESQLAALEKAKAEKEVQGEFETECPGYCGAQDTYYVGWLTIGLLRRNKKRRLRCETPSQPYSRH